MREGLSEVCKGEAVGEFLYINNMQTQTATFKRTKHTTCIEDELEGQFPVFKGWDYLEDRYHRAMDDYKNGKCKPWDEAFADIKARYST